MLLFNNDNDNKKKKEKKKKVLEVKNPIFANANNAFSFTKPIRCLTGIDLFMKFPFSTDSQQ